jgi:hypothetical protein
LHTVPDRQVRCRLCTPPSQSHRLDARQNSKKKASSNWHSLYIPCYVLPKGSHIHRWEGRSILTRSYKILDHIKWDQALFLACLWLYPKRGDAIALTATSHTAARDQGKKEREGEMTRREEREEERWRKYPRYLSGSHFHPPKVFSSHPGTPPGRQARLPRTAESGRLLCPPCGIASSTCRQGPPPHRAPCTGSPATTHGPTAAIKMPLQYIHHLDRFQKAG